MRPVNRLDLIQTGQPIEQTAQPPLSGQQQMELIRCLSAEPPSRRPPTLWTATRVRDLVDKQFNVLLDFGTLAGLLRHLNLIQPPPLARFRRQHPSKAEEWIALNFPVIRAMARDAGAEVIFADEASDIGLDVEGEGKGTAETLTAMRAVSLTGAARFMMIHGGVDGASFSLFASRLVAESESPVYLVTEPFAAHRSRAVRALADTSAGRLRLFYLPR